MKPKADNNLVEMPERYPYKNSPQQLTLESEIKRVANDREESMDITIANLAKLSGITTRQIYNYRSGKTDIPAGLIPVFCKQFDSNALMMSVFLQCEPSCSQMEAFDLVKLANQSCRETLKVHDKFLEITDDGVVDGFERNEFKLATASAVANFHRLEGVIESEYQRRRA